MLLATVEGRLVSTIKHPSLNGAKLMLVQPLAADGERPDGVPLAVVDTVGAGKGDRVMITSDGPTTRTYLKDDNTPVRWSIVAVAD